jgi:hypothetical protein
MSWATKRKVLLSICSVIALVLALVVLIGGRTYQERLLAALGLVGGVAILIVSLPDSGNGKNGDHK